MRLTKIRAGNHWGHVNSRREFFDSYARRNGFEALNPENWYKVDIASVLSTKVPHLRISLLVLAVYISQLLFV